MSEMTNARLMDSYTAIMQQNETLKKDMVTAGPQVQIYGNVALRDNSPEEPYAVLALDGTLLGTGMTQSHGWIAYGPIAGSYKEVDVRVGGVTRRVVTSPWTAATAASAAPECSWRRPRRPLPRNVFRWRIYPAWRLLCKLSQPMPEDNAVVFKR